MAEKTRVCEAHTECSLGRERFGPKEERGLSLGFTINERAGRRAEVKAKEDEK